MRHAPADARQCSGNPDGLSATCEATTKRGWEQRWHHSVFIVDRDGKLVDEWPFMEKMFAQDKCGRGPHKIKMNPCDAEKHVWIIDDQQRHLEVHARRQARPDARDRGTARA